MNETFDVIVLGSGAAGLTAACAAAAQQQRVLLLESSAWIGGTTAISGGMVWLPANEKMQAAGRPDSLAQAREYLTRLLPPGADLASMDTFLRQGEAALQFLAQRTCVRLKPVLNYPDYYPDLPGATHGGRVLESVDVDGAALGRDFLRLRAPLPEFTLFGGMMVSRADIPHFRRLGRAWASSWRAAQLLARYAGQRLRHHRGTTLYLGNALAASLFLSARQLGVQIRTGVQVSALLREPGGPVTGVQLDGAAGTCIGARRGVILATGGISHRAALRRDYVHSDAEMASATVSGQAGLSGAELALAAGATLGAAFDNNAFWVPASRFTRADGTAGVYPHTVTDRGKPGLIAVDQQGQRYVNEALSYHEFVLAQLRHGPQALPTYLICGRKFLWKYGLGRIKPFSLSTAADRRSGYLKMDATLAGLARQLGIPPDALCATVQRYDADALRGEDTQLGKGGDVYQRYLGDAEQRPNPCVAPVGEGPYYAVAVYPADLGMSAGLATDPEGRVYGPAQQVIPGLYACGNDRQSFMSGTYPGPGITLGPAVVFGYLSGLAAAATPAVQT